MGYSFSFKDESDERSAALHLNAKCERAAGLLRCALCARQKCEEACAAPPGCATFHIGQEIIADLIDTTCGAELFCFATPPRDSQKMIRRLCGALRIVAETVRDAALPNSRSAVFGERVRTTAHSLYECTKWSAHSSNSRDADPLPEPLPPFFSFRYPHTELDANNIRQIAEFLIELTEDLLAETADCLFQLVPVSSYSMLENVVDVVFRQAIDSTDLQDFYAQVCKNFSKRAAAWSDRYLDTNIKELKGDAAPGCDGWYMAGPTRGEWQGPYNSQDEARGAGQRLTNFKRLLLNRCQQEFMKESASRPLDAEEAADAAAVAAAAAAGTPLPAAELAAAAAARSDSRREQRALLKKRKFAFMSFIGHLYKIDDTLNYNIMHFCIARLLAQGKIEETDEESVEALCRLLTLIGDKFKAEDRGVEKPHFPLFANLLERLVYAPHLSNGVRRLVSDVLTGFGAAG
jgi:hypothetical protein